MPWARNLTPLILLGLFLEALDEGVADAPALFLRLGDARQRLEKPLLGLDDVQVGLEVLGELAR